MSAIFGIYNLDGKPVALPQMERMSNILSHRGNDQSDIWIDSKIGLGHRMMWTTPESKNEKLPITGYFNALSITVDCRLDNRADLIKMLGPFQHSDIAVTDSELILASYNKWGVECPNYLLGDFAFAIWDAQNDHIFCARDHFGIKSFYYHFSEKIFAFATEIKALLLLPEVSKNINETKIANHIENKVGDKEITFYKDIFRLLPGCGLIINKTKCKKIQYWKLKLPQELKLKSDAEYAEALREHFIEAVKCRLRSSVPIGTMLSGGIDSSSITCVARKLLSEKRDSQLHTFSAVFDQVKECDERQFINTVLRENGVSPHLIPADNYGPFADIDKVLQVHDEPVALSNYYLNWLSYKTANKQGVKVILDGFDGDSTISHGLGFFAELAQAGRWVKLLRENSAYAKKIGESWQQAAWSWIWFYGINPWITRNKIANKTRSYSRRIRNRLGKRADLNAINPNQIKQVELNSDFVKRIKFSKIGERNIKHLTERENHLWNLTENGSLSSAIEAIGYGASAFSIELRFPFWDKRLIEFCLSIPSEQKIKKGWTRMVMRRAMDGILPSEIQWRAAKTDMAPSFNYGLLKFGKDLMDKFIVNNSEIVGDYVNIETLREAHQRFLKSEASVSDIVAIQRCVSLALWLQKGN